MFLADRVSMIVGVEGGWDKNTDAQSEGAASKRIAAAQRARWAKLNAKTQRSSKNGEGVESCL
jgi:hypothetical protein